MCAPRAEFHSAAITTDYKKMPSAGVSLSSDPQAVSHICAAEDDFNDLLALADLSDFAGESLLFKMEQQAPLKIWADKFNAYPNTFIWYRWRDYDDASVWQKPLIFQDIKQLTNR